MDAEFVKKILDQALRNQRLMPLDDANAIWDVYKRFIADTRPEMNPLITEHEQMMKKHFFASIDLFMHVPKFLVDNGVNKLLAAMTMHTLEGNIRKELHRMLEEEKGKS